MSKWWRLSGSGICDNCYLLDNCHVRVNGIWVNCHIGTNGIDTSVLLGQMELSQLSYWDKWNWVNCRIDTTVLLGQMELSQQSLSQLSMSQLSFGQLLWHLIVLCLSLVTQPGVWWLNSVSWPGSFTLQSDSSRHLGECLCVSSLYSIYNCTVHITLVQYILLFYSTLYCNDIQ